MPLKKQPSQRTTPNPDKHPGTHLLRGHAAYALRDYNAYVMYAPGHPLRALYGRLFDAVAERMQKNGDAYNVSVDDLIAAFARSRLLSRGFLLRVSEDHQTARVLAPTDAEWFVGGLMVKAGLYNRNASQKKVDVGPRNAAIREKVWAYVKKDLYCVFLPEPLIDEIRAEHNFYADPHVGKPLSQLKRSCHRLLAAQGYKQSTKKGIRHFRGTEKTYAILCKLALERFIEQNEYLSVSDIAELARASGHDMRPNGDQEHMVETAMRTFFTFDRSFQEQAYRKENAMRFALHRSVVLGGKTTLNKNDVMQAMAAANLPATSRKLCLLLMPPGEFTAMDLAGIAKT